VLLPWAAYIGGEALHVSGVISTVAAGLMLGWYQHEVFSAAPDAVAAKAVLERVPLPSRLLVLLEGESLLNDAAGLVLFRFAVAAAMTGVFSIGDAAITFGYLAVGGLAVAWPDFRRNLGGILLLAVGAVAFTTLVVTIPGARNWT
jgi:NhaP-type Na+/H+ or K+/H+ antiporter